MTIDSRCDSEHCHHDWKVVSHHRMCCNQASSLDRVRPSAHSMLVRRFSYSDHQRRCGLQTFVTMKPALHCLPPPGAPRLCSRSALRIYKYLQDTQTPESLASRMLLEQEIPLLRAVYRLSHYPWPTLDRDLARACRGHNVHWGTDRQKSVRCTTCQVHFPSMRRFLLHAATLHHIREGICRLHRNADAQPPTRDPRHHFGDILVPYGHQSDPTAREEAPDTGEL